MLKNTKHNKRKGIALVMVLIFVTVFSTLSVAMFSLSTNNIIGVKNSHHAGSARACAESGLEMIRYYVSRVTLPGKTDESQLFDEFAAALQSHFEGVYAATYDEIEETLIIGDVDNLILLDASTQKGFHAQITPDGIGGITIRVTGYSDSLERTIVACFSYEEQCPSVFDYGVATKGPMKLGSLLLDGVNDPSEGNIYIESLLDTDALAIQNAQIAGSVDIANPGAVVSMSGGQSTIGGESGQEAVDNHVETGVPVTGFPVPAPAYFEQFVSGITIDSSTDINFYKQGGVLENVRVASNTDPKFTADIRIVGVLYIESPNRVEFSGHCDITGIIVAEGDYTDNSGSNQLTFRGTVSSQSVTELPDEDQFEGLRSETGTFVMAPGFAVSFGGNFGTINGCIIANGVEFFGNAGGEIGGTILNYSDDTMELRGGDLYFNKSESQDTPAGFTADIGMQYHSDSYEEAH